jgi:hypothetical protein
MTIVCPRRLSLDRHRNTGLFMILWFIVAVQFFGVARIAIFEPVRQGR